jgi:hypothetical protein
LLLTNGSVVLPGDKTDVIFHLDPNLGLVIQSKKGA